MTSAAVVLAAGKGTRFRSDLAKVLHPASGRTMLRWVLESLRPLVLDRVVVVVGHQAQAVAAEAAAAELPGLVTVVQKAQRGTGHAVRAAVDDGALDGVGAVLVLPGDAPLLTTDSLEALREAQRGASAAVLTARLADPFGYGRVLRDVRGGVTGIVEQRDATVAEQAIDEINTSVYAFACDALVDQLGRLDSDNTQSEEYLTDVIAPLASGPGGVRAVEATPVEAQGVNDRAQLAEVAAHLRARLLTTALRAGVSIIDPRTTYVGPDVVLEPDATILPGTHLEGTTRIAAGAVVGPDSRLVDATVEAGAEVAYSVVLGARVGAGATVGPFSYLRPAADLGERSKVGAFVEVKKSTIGAGSKVPHLSYVGDAEIGRDANIGAATVTVNYDGHDKYRTIIGDGAFIGSDTMLVAPVTVGERGITGAGSVITSDVPDGALAVERSEQRTIFGYADRRDARAARRREQTDPPSDTPPAPPKG